MKRAVITGLFAIAVLTGCESKTTPCYDHTSVVYGSVYDAETLELIDTVLVSFAYAPSMPDSICFEGDTLRHVYIADDSVYVYDPRCFSAVVCTCRGRYRFEWFLGPWPPPYEWMFAVKEGYRMWRFDPGRDEVRHIGTYTDSLAIYMERVALRAE